jgi:hypothetical protein
MKQLIVLLVLLFSFVCEGQSKKEDYYKDINYKNVVEIKGLLYLKADTTLVTGKVIRYNKKNQAKKYILVSNGKPDNLGWIQISDGFARPKESGLGSFVTAAAWITGVTMAVTGNDIDIPIGTNNYSQNDISGTGNYFKYNKENISKAYSDMSDRNEISKKINSEKEAINGPFEEYYEDGQLEIKGNYIDEKNSQ